MKYFLSSMVLFALSLSANAATIEYVVVSGVSGNAYTAIGGGYAADSPLVSAGGTFVYDTVDNTLTGDISFNDVYPAYAVDTIYWADWDIDFDVVGTTNLNHTSVTCFDPTSGNCATIGASPDVVSLIAGNLSDDTFAQQATIKWLVGGAPSSSSAYGFTLQVVPVPAAVWLFGSALGLLGWARRKA